MERLFDWEQWRIIAISTVSPLADIALGGVLWKDEESKA